MVLRPRTLVLASYDKEDYSMVWQPEVRTATGFEGAVPGLGRFRVSVQLLADSLGFEHDPPDADAAKRSNKHSEKPRIFCTKVELRCLGMWSNVPVYVGY